MENIFIANVCGLCAGCRRALTEVTDQLNLGKDVTLFKEIVHNKNVNNMLVNKGAKLVDDIDKIEKDTLVIIRGHGEPPQTFEYFDKHNIKYKDCTCPNVKKIHGLVSNTDPNNDKVIVLGKYKKAMHPEVQGIVSWAKDECILIETEEDLDKLNEIKNQKLFLVCQTTFNMSKATMLIDKITNIAKTNCCKLTVNKTLCFAQQETTLSATELAKSVDLMIVVGGKNSSNTHELFNHVKVITNAIFIEDINSYKEELALNNLTISPTTKIGLTAGASTMKEELVSLKELIQKDLATYNA